MLQKKNRLSTTYEFNKVRRVGKRIRNPLFDLFYLDVREKPKGAVQVGIVVTNKYSKIAPVRNRVKRVFREVIKLNLEHIPKGFWLVIHPKKLAEEKTHEEISTEFNKVLSKISLT
jgi:ribonuclease P protein component